MVWAVLVEEIRSSCNEFAQLYSQMEGLVFGLLVGVEGVFHSEMRVWKQEFKVLSNSCLSMRK